MTHDRAEFVQTQSRITATSPLLLPLGYPLTVQLWVFSEAVVFE